MGDTKKGREKQAQDEERRQRERELTEAVDRATESEPVAETDGELGDLDGALENHDYPMRTDDVIAAHGDREVETQRGLETVDAILTPVDDERYDSPDAVRNRILGRINRE